MIFDDLCKWKCEPELIPVQRQDVTTVTASLLFWYYKLMLIGWRLVDVTYVSILGIKTILLVNSWEIYLLRGLRWKNRISILAQNSFPMT